MRIRLQFFMLGLLVGWWLAQRRGRIADTPARLRTQAEPAVAARPPGEPKPSIPAAHVEPLPAAVSTTESESDPLTEIKGIGLTFERALRVAGITTFSQLAACDSDALAEKLGGRVSGERIRRENWISQAQERARAGK